VGKGALAPCPPSIPIIDLNGGHGAKRAPLPTLQIRRLSAIDGRKLIAHNHLGKQPEKVVPCSKNVAL
jgi:hypothetical protein